jgi:hypothetical protein
MTLHLDLNWLLFKPVECEIVCRIGDPLRPTLGFSRTYMDINWNLYRPFTDAYYKLPMHPDHQKFSKFTFDQQQYKFVAVPMGLSSACHYFTKIMKVPLSVLREKHDIAITGYIDDTFLNAPTPQKCKPDLHIAVDLFQELGFMISESKNVFTPTTKIKYLGFVIDSVSMTVVPTTEKNQKLKKATKKLLNKDSTTIRHLVQVEGGLLATHPRNPWAPLFTKQLEIEKLEALSCNKFNFDAYMVVSTAIKCDLHWWLNNLGHTKVYLQESYPNLVIHTDASLQGYGLCEPISIPVTKEVLFLTHRTQGSSEMKGHICQEHPLSNHLMLLAGRLCGKPS